MRGFPVLAETRNANVSAWKSDWLRAVASLIAANARFEDGQAIDPTQNNIIGGILRRLQAFAADADAPAREEQA